MQRTSSHPHVRCAPCHAQLSSGERVAEFRRWLPRGGHGCKRARCAGDSYWDNDGGAAGLGRPHVCPPPAAVSGELTRMRDAALHGLAMPGNSVPDPHPIHHSCSCTAKQTSAQGGCLTHKEAGGEEGGRSGRLDSTGPGPPRAWRLAGVRQVNSASACHHSAYVEQARACGSRNRPPPPLNRRQPGARRAARLLRPALLLPTSTITTLRSSKRAWSSRKAACQPGLGCARGSTCSSSPEGSDRLGMAAPGEPPRGPPRQPPSAAATGRAVVSERARLQCRCSPGLPLAQVAGAAAGMRSREAPSSAASSAHPPLPPSPVIAAHRRTRPPPLHPPPLPPPAAGQHLGAQRGAERPAAAGGGHHRGHLHAAADAQAAGRRRRRRHAGRAACYAALSQQRYRGGRVLVCGHLV